MTTVKAEMTPEITSADRVREIVNGPVSELSGTPEATVNDAEAVDICLAAVGATISMRPGLEYDKAISALNHAEIERAAGRGNLVELRRLRDEVERLKTFKD